MTDPFVQIVESVARSLGMAVTCRIVHREALQLYGHYFPALDEYEVRCGRRIWWFPIGMVNVGPIHAIEHVKAELKRERT